MKKFNFSEMLEEDNARVRKLISETAERIFEELDDNKDDVVVSENENSSTPLLIEVAPEDIHVEPIESSIQITQDQPIAETMNSETVINKEESNHKKVIPGLKFDHLVVHDPAEEIAKHPEYVIPIPPETQNPLVNNLEVISEFPEMNKIQEIVRNLGYDVDMSVLYDKFIVCMILDNGVQNPYKFFLVDYEGYYMNKIPKIFLSEMNKFIDEWPVIHFNDSENLINHLKGSPIIKRPKPIVTNTQRKIGRYIINYGRHVNDEEETAKFEKICVSKIIPYIEKEIKPLFPECSFRITEYSNPGVWTLICDSKTPYRFGEVESLTNKVIYIRGTGFDENGKILISQDII